MIWISEDVDDYHQFLNNEITSAILEKDWIQIATPAYNIFNDRVYIYCKKDEDSIILSDGGETICNLQLAGIYIQKANTKICQQDIINNYGISISNDNELIIETNIKNFVRAKYNLLCAIIEVLNIYISIVPNKLSMFKTYMAKYMVT